MFRGPTSRFLRALVGPQHKEICAPYKGWNFSEISQKGVFQQNRPKAVLQRFRNNRYQAAGIRHIAAARPPKGNPAEAGLLSMLLLLGQL